MSPYRETAQTLTDLWIERVDGLPVEDVVARLTAARQICHSGASYDDLDQLMDCLSDPGAVGTPAEAALWGQLVVGWAYGYPAVHTFPIDRYPIGTTPTRFCPYCGTSGLAPGTGPTECGFCDREVDLP